MFHNNQLKPDLMSQLNPVAPSNEDLGIIAFNTELFVEFLENKGPLSGKDVVVFF